MSHVTLYVCFYVLRGVGGDGSGITVSCVHVTLYVCFYVIGGVGWDGSRRAACRLF